MELIKQLKCVLLGHRYGGYISTTIEEYADMGYPSITLNYRKCERCGIEEYHREEYAIIEELEKKRKAMARKKS